MTLIIINTSTGEKDIGTRVGDARGGARSPAVSPNGHTETKGWDYSGERLEGWYVSLIPPLPPLPSPAHLFCTPHIPKVLTSFAVMVERLARRHHKTTPPFCARSWCARTCTTLCACCAPCARQRTRRKWLRGVQLVLLFAVQQKRVDECMEVLSYSTYTLTSEVLEIIR